jgi:hypothetical protein
MQPTHASGASDVKHDREAEMFTSEQPDRIDFEKALVGMEFPGFRQFVRASSFGFIGQFAPKAGSGSYELTAEASEAYPYVEPDLLVTRPHVLWMYGGLTSINSLGTTHDYHAHDNGPDGCVKICHVLLWDPSMTFVQVLLKGIIWLEAYAIHLRTGATIAQIIDSFEEYYRIWSNPMIR